MMMKKLESLYRHGGDADEDLHSSCTLDQSYYMSRNAKPDIGNQVVLRHTRKALQNTRHNKTQDAETQNTAGDIAGNQ